MNEIPLYNGEVPQAPQVQLPHVPEMPHVQGNGELINRAIDQVTDVVHRYAQLRDFGVRQQVEHRQRELDLQMQQDFERRAELPWGAEGSFFSADGQLDDDAVAAFTQGWQQKNNDLPDGYWLTENAMRSDDERQARNDQMVSRVTLNLLSQESKNREQACKDNFDLALAQGDFLGACRIADDAVASGQVTTARGQLMKLQIGRSALRRRVSNGGPINIGGTDYDGDSAALAIAEARANKDFSSGDDDVPQAPSSGSDRDLSLEIPPPAESPDSVPGIASPSAAEFSAGGDLTLASSGNTVTPVTPDVVIGEKQGEGPQSLTLSRSDSMVMPELPGESWQQGDFLGIVRSLPMRDAMTLQESLSQNTGILREELPDGSSLFSCRASANNATQRCVAVANQEGEINPETARSMIANIAISSIYDNPGATVPSVVSLFEDSGVFEALGNGDPEIGRNRASGIVREFFERGQLGTTKLNLQAIQNRVNNYLSSTKFGKDRLWEWKEMESLRPLCDEDGVFDKPEDSAGRAHWFALYQVYKKYRDRFNPEQSFKPLEKEEFEEKAHKFYLWYMKDIYSKQKEEYQKAARDWYMARIGDALVNHLDVNEGKAEYGSYASDLDLVDSILDDGNSVDSLSMPKDFGVEAMMKHDVISENKLEDRRSVFRKKAEDDCSSLHEIKQFRANEMKREKAEEKAKEKAKENEMKRSIRMARLQTRNCPWVWDGKNDDSSPPFCYIPEAEYRDLIEKMGYDGIGNVYVRLNGCSIPVVGFTKGNYIKLNTSATMKVQPKNPRRRRNADNLQTRGTLGFTYSFR